MRMSRRLDPDPDPDSDRTSLPRSRASHDPIDSRHSHSSPLHLHSPLSPDTHHSHSTTSSSTTTSHQSETAASPPPLSPPMNEDDDVSSPSTSSSPSPTPNSPPSSTLPPPLPPLPSSRPSHTPAFPSREDCWSEPATHTLIEAWGTHYMALNRGNLRQKHWQEVADAVNALHAHTKKQYRTDIQCKNRIDTLKKKYKVEKSRVLESNGQYSSTWPFFTPLDSLIGNSFKPSSSLAPTPPVHRKRLPAPLLLPPPSAVPVAPRSKRPASASVHDSVFRRNLPVKAAAVESEEESEELSRSRSSAAGNRRRDSDGVGEGYRKLAEAIGRFGEIYERVEEAKQRQMVELEKERMKFAKDLEIQRMKLFMESQVQVEKIKRAKQNS
ncbi:unnamed protein product [Ilex paraguariensis]|uniref:Myb/SANT-like DNA-binding domain-containing protein n=1 Tax=Ilex paraguariensis TaxID=185542 RepID=A0ABC8QKU0_9AQUA